MYESSRNTSCAPQRRRRRHRAARRKRILIGAAVLVCLLTCVVQALEKKPTSMLADTSAVYPQKAFEAAAISLPSATQTATQTPIDALATPGASAEEWQLLLVNLWNPLPDGYTVSLTQLKNGHSVDARCYPDLQAMMDDCRAAGLKPVICSSYRTQAKQERLFNNKVNQYLAKGFSAEAARAEAGKSVAIPGTSEHQLGLAVDVVDLNNQNLNKSQEDTAVQRWLMEKSWKYGFILRYPSDKSDITGIIYEPWHYRYVGKDAAQEIYEQSICFEEYLTQREEKS